MRARWNRLMHAAPVIEIGMDLREAYSVGSVLARVEGDGMRERRMRSLGQDLLLVGLAPSVPAAEEMVEALRDGADPATESGRMALAAAQAVATAIDRARRAEERAIVGTWVRMEEGRDEGGKLKAEEGENAQRSMEDGQERTETDTNGDAE